MHKNLSKSLATAFQVDHMIKSCIEIKDSCEYSLASYIMSLKNGSCVFH